MVVGGGLGVLRYRPGSSCTIHHRRGGVMREGGFWGGGGFQSVSQRRRGEGAASGRSLRARSRPDTGTSSLQHGGPTTTGRRGRRGRGFGYTRVLSAPLGFIRLHSGFSGPPLLTTVPHNRYSLPPPVQQQLFFRFDALLDFKPPLFNFTVIFYTVER